MNSLSCSMYNKM